MVKKRRKTYTLILEGVILLLGVTLAIVLIINKQNRGVQVKNELINNDFYPVNEIMQSAGYEKRDKDIYQKKDCGISISIEYDYKEQKCSKNEYIFDIGDAVICNNQMYLKKEVLESILGKDLEYKQNQIICGDWNKGNWADNYSLVAHAGGAVREKEYNTYYTNSKEALIQNYNLGYRVFEFDFYLTSDNELALVHDWTQFGYMDGTALSTEEWKQFETFGSPITDSRFTTMVVDDILDEMIVNKDMYLVTDTKGTEFPEELTKLEFEIIRDKALEKDPELLERIIPQIYNIDMYSMLESVYHFPNEIFTIYATGEDMQDIMRLCSEKSNISVLTAPYNDNRMIPDCINYLHENGIKIYGHTINTYSEISPLASYGFDGFYTDLLLPQEMKIYDNTK